MTATGDAAIMVEQSERYCGNCAHGLKPEDHFCPNCGRPVEETTTGRAKRFYQEHELLSLGIAVIVAAAVAYGLWSIVNPHTVAQRTDFIQMVVGIVGGVTLIGGLLLNFRGQNQNQRITSEQIRLTRKAQDQNERNTLAQIEVTRRGQVTERFTKAIEQLGENEKPDVRLGGIYALKQIAEQQAQIAEQEEARQAEALARHVEILEILASYVRERAAYERTRTLPRSDYDLEAVLRVFKGLRERYKPWQDRLQLQLSYVDLFGFDISGIHLEGAILAGAHLEGATLQNAFLESTNLQGAHLENADLSGAHLELADLRGAHLEGANLSKAKLMGARLDEADLQATKLHGTVLEGKLADNIREDLIAYLKATYPEAEDFSEEHWRDARRATFGPGQDQIKQAIGDDETVLPNGVERPKWWKQVPELSSTEPLIAGHYLIILGKTLMSFRLGDEWYGQFDYLPYYFALSRSSVGSAGPQLSFAHVESVFDPEQLDKLNPENYREAIRERKTPSIAWFTRHSCLVPGDSNSQQDCVGDPALPGAQLEFTVNPDKVKDIPSFRQPCIPLFPLGRAGELAVFEGQKTRVIVLNAGGESLTIQIEGSEDEFVTFLEDTTEILKSVKWPAPEQPKEEAPED